MRIATRSHPRLDLRDQLTLAGVGTFVAPLAMQFMNFLPRTCDPYAQGVIILVQGLQRLLNKRGAHLAVDGGLGEATLKELIKYAGPRWYDKSWTQLYSDVLSGQRWPGWERAGRGAYDDPVDAEADDEEMATMGLGDTSLSDVIKSPAVLIAGGVFVWWTWFRKGGRR